MTKFLAVLLKLNPGIRDSALRTRHIDQTLHTLVTSDDAVMVEGTVEDVQCPRIIMLPAVTQNVCNVTVASLHRHGKEWINM